MRVLIFAAAVAILVLAYFHGARRARKQVLSRFSSRSPRTAGQFASEFYGELNEDQRVEEALCHLASELEMPLQFLLPTDRFDHELRAVPGWGFYSGHGLLFRELHVWSRAKGLNALLDPIRTLDDYIKAFLLLAPRGLNA